MPSAIPPTETSSESLRFILGLKLRGLRHERELSLRELAGRCGLSISYLSEIEKGKKYPKPDKLLKLAAALEVPFDELVSLRVTDELGPLKAALSSGFLEDFPFQLFGVEPGDLFALLAEDPIKVGALIRTFLEVGRTYDVHIEQFLLAALRSYQQLHANYFADLERAAAEFRERRGWPAGERLEGAALAAVLQGDWGYAIEEDTLAGHPDLGTLRSVFVDGRPPRLLVNGRLLPSQKAFVLAREIGYRELGLGARAITSSWLEVESFEQVLNNFKASYFAGALLLDAERLGADLEEFLAAPTWRGDALLELIRRHGATPEMFFYRLTELVPERFGLREIFFLRFTRPEDRPDPVLTKVFNLSRVPVPHGIGLDEHYCRRWPALELLARLAAAPDRHPERPLVAVQRSRFLDAEAEFFVLSVARPLVLTPDSDSAVSLGFLLDDDFRRRVAFWDDPAIPRRDVNLTCERCRLTQAQCAERAAPPRLVRRQERQTRKKAALADLLRGYRSP